MRGDFARDLYAKTLALVGLAALAATGALLDYWPVGVRVAVPSTPVVPVTQQPVVSDGTPGPSHEMPTTSVRRLRGSAATDRGAAPAPQPPSFAADAPAGPLGTHVVLAAHERFSDVMNDAVLLADKVAEPFLETVESALEQRVEARPSSDAPLMSSPDQDGLVTVAFRKTGSSIAKTGAKAGSSIVGAVRGLRGAVRKALPVI